MVNRIRKAMDEKDQGFTLIELLVVIIIIGILAAIAIPVFLNQRKKGVDASIRSDLKNAATTVETWSTDNPSLAVPTATSANGSAGTGALEGFKSSPGNTIKVKPKGTSIGLYTICGFNAGASDATTTAKSFLYDSEAGGLQSGTTTTAC